MPNNLVFNNVASQLQTQIFGTDGNTTRAIKTDSNGRLEVVGTFTAITTETFIEEKVDLMNVSGKGTALNIDTSTLKVYSFYILNLGNATFTVKVQISPVNNDSYFVDDVSGEIAVGTGAEPKAVVVPRHYLKYTRLQYEAVDGDATAEVWFNGRG